MFNTTKRLAWTDIPRPISKSDQKNSQVVDIMNMEKITDNDLQTAIKNHWSIMWGWYGAIVWDGSYMIVSSDKWTNILWANWESILNDEKIWQLPLDHIELLTWEISHWDELILMCLNGANEYKDKFST